MPKNKKQHQEESKELREDSHDSDSSMESVIGAPEQKYIDIISTRSERRSALKTHLQDNLTLVFGSQEDCRDVFSRIVTTTSDHYNIRRGTIEKGNLNEIYILFKYQGGERQNVLNLESNTIESLQRALEGYATDSLSLSEREDTVNANHFLQHFLPSESTLGAEKAARAAKLYDAILVKSTARNEPDASLKADGAVKVDSGKGCCAVL